MGFEGSQKTLIRGNLYLGVWVSTLALSVKAIGVEDLCKTQLSGMSHVICESLRQRYRELKTSGAFDALTVTTPKVQR